MRNLGISAMLATFILSAAAVWGATPQTVCPITGKKVDKSIYTDYEGKRIYFCSLTCPVEFAKDPAKYVKQMEDKGVTLEKRQTLCPVKGEKINKEFFADYQGKRVYFCCNQCPAEFKKDPAKYIKKLEADGITLDATPVEPSGVLKDGVRVVDFDAFRYGYSPDPLIVRAGEKVRLQAASRDVRHGLAIAEVKLDAAISPGARKAIEFTAPAKPGKYVMKCSIFCGAGHTGMIGTLEVLPAAAP